MNNIWDKSIDVNQSMIKELLQEQFSLSVDSIVPLGEGFDNSAFLINDGYVFRFPHRNEGLICMQNEITLLPYFKSKLSFPLPELVMIGTETKTYPFPFSGYKILQGELLTFYQSPLVGNEKFASTLGSWLKELHRLPINEEHRTVIQGEHDWRLNVPHRIQRVLETLKKYENYFIENNFDISQLIAMIESFKDFKILNNHLCYVHGDLYAKHIIVNNEGMPAGLIDWGDTHIGHPAVDIAVGIMIFDNNALKQFLKAYSQCDEGTFSVAVFRAFYHSILAFPYFCQIGEESTVKWTKKALENSIVHVNQNEWLKNDGI